MSHQPLEHEEKSRPESKAERQEKRAENTIRADASPEDREGLKDRHLEAEAKEQKNRAMSPEEAATKAKRGEKVVGDATKALGFSLGIDKINKKGDKDILLPGRTPEEVKALRQAESSSKRDLPFDPDELQGKATTQDKPSFDEQLSQIQQDAIKQGAPPELFADKVRFVPAGTALEIRGHKYELNELSAQGLNTVSDATPEVMPGKDIGKLSQAYGLDYSLERARQKAQEESHKQFDGKDAKSNDEFLDMFLNGSGNDRQLHTKRGDPLLEDFIKSPGVQAMRDQYLKLDCPAETTKLSYGSKDAFVDTVAKPFGDSATHLFTDLFDEKHLGSVGTQVGGFGNPPKEYPWATANATRCNPDGKPDVKGDFVQYQVTNVAGSHSWGAHALSDRQLGSTGPYRSIIQVFSWTEPIPHKANEKK